MDQLASLSRSGGHAANEDALLDFKVQEKFRAHIENKLRTFWDREASTGLGEFDEVSIDDKQRWFVLNDVLLLLRKLREALMSSQRVDDFAVEVYELSARIALQTSNHTHFISSLSRLVPDLYVAHDLALSSSSSTASLPSSSKPPPAPTKPSERSPLPPTTTPTASSLAVSLSNLSISTSPPSIPSSSNRTLYTSLLLIYHLTHLSSPPSYLSLLACLPSRFFPPSSFSPIPPLVLRAQLSSSYSAFQRLLSSPHVHPLERICLGFGSEQRRIKAWKVVRASYLDVGPRDLEWLGERVLGLKKGGNDGGVEGWLKEKGVEAGENGRWAIRKGKD
ncbi:hypothetical protein BDY24DRAFT_414757 [Mrakia frigida]|uniref:uncharacterized protein n=1 Tax=Mrakia frigida TaxID=29902 RepID=UPI003FCC1741